MCKINKIQIGSYQRHSSLKMESRGLLIVWILKYKATGYSFPFSLPSLKKGKISSKLGFQVVGMP